jgi:hypothetical protein
MSTSNQLPHHGYHSWDSFPKALWSSYALNARMPLDLVMERLPKWLDDQALEEIKLDYTSNPDEGGKWWGDIWEQMGTGAHHTQEGLMMGLAMAATYGWAEVTRNLLEMNAPVNRVKRPAEGWQWMDEAVMAKGKDCSALAMCVRAMRGSSTNSVFHPLHRQTLGLLLEAGGNPNQMDAESIQFGLCYGPVAQMLIEHGLDGWLRPDSYGEKKPKHANEEALPIVSKLFDPDLVLSLAARRKALAQFVEHGMDLVGPVNGQSALDYMVRSVWGLRQMDVLLQHAQRDKLARMFQDFDQEKLIKGMSKLKGSELDKIQVTLEHGRLANNTAKAAGGARSVRL